MFSLLEFGFYNVTDTEGAMENVMLNAYDKSHRVNEEIGAEMD